jgi:predicted transcriptional regulator
MLQRPNPPELVILKSLWENGPLPVRKLHDICGADLKWSFSSTRKTVSRMINKDMIAVNAEEGAARYSARTSKTATLAFLTRDFMHRVLEVDGPIPHNIYRDSKLLNDDELEEMIGLG